MKIDRAFVLISFIVLSLLISGCVNYRKQIELEEKDFDIKFEIVTASTSMLSSPGKMDFKPEENRHYTLNSSEMNLIRHVDSNMLSISTGGVGSRCPSQIFDLNITDDVDDIFLKWTGSSDTWHTEENRILFTVFDHERSMWKNVSSILFKEKHPKGVKVHNITITNIGDLLANDDRLTLLISGPLGVGDSSSKISTDQIYAKGRT